MVNIKSDTSDEVRETVRGVANKKILLKYCIGM